MFGLNRANFVCVLVRPIYSKFHLWQLSHLNLFLFPVFSSLYITRTIWGTVKHLYQSLKVSYFVWPLSLSHSLSLSLRWFSYCSLYCINEYLIKKCNWNFLLIGFVSIYFISLFVLFINLENTEINVYLPIPICFN